MENYMNDSENKTGLSQDSLINLFLHTATKEDLASHKSEVDRRFNEVDKKFDQINQRFDKLEQRLMWGFGLMTSILIAIHFIWYSVFNI